MIMLMGSVDHGLFRLRLDVIQGLLDARWAVTIFRIQAPAHEVLAHFILEFSNHELSLGQFVAFVKERIKPVWNSILFALSNIGSTVRIYEGSSLRRLEWHKGHFFFQFLPIRHLVVMGDIDY